MTQKKYDPVLHSVNPNNKNKALCGLDITRARFNPKVLILSIPAFIAWTGRTRCRRCLYSAKKILREDENGKEEFLQEFSIHPEPALKKPKKRKRK